MRVAIIGGGIGGLTTALSLHAAGIEVDLFEAVAEIQPLGVGINLLRTAIQKWRSGTPVDVDADAAVSQMVANLQQPFKRALVISLLNPKAILFFVSFFVQFVDPAYAYPALTFAVLAVAGGVVKPAQDALLDLLARKTTAVMTNVPGPAEKHRFCGSTILPRLRRRRFSVAQVWS